MALPPDGTKKVYLRHSRKSWHATSAVLCTYGSFVCLYYGYFLALRNPATAIWRHDEHFCGATQDKRNLMLRQVAEGQAASHGPFERTEIARCMESVGF